MSLEDVLHNVIPTYTNNKTSCVFRVVSSDGTHEYTVTVIDLADDMREWFGSRDYATCSCPGWRRGFGNDCKHIRAIRQVWFKVRNDAQP